MDAQAKEMRPGMLKFNNDTHVIRIERDSHGIMTVTVRDRARTEKGVDMTVTFPQEAQSGCGVDFHVWWAFELHQVVHPSVTEVNNNLPIRTNLLIGTTNQNFCCPSCSI